MRLVAALVLLVAGPGFAATQTVTFPLVVDTPILEAAMRRELGMADGGSLELWGSPGGCHWAVADEVGLATDGQRLRVSVTGSAVVGFRFLWFCLSPIAWQGSIVVRMRPVVARDWQLRFESFEAEARDPDGNPSPLGNAALELARGELEERLHRFHFDLAPPADEAKQLIRIAADARNAEAAIEAIDTLRPLETIVDEEGVRVRVAMDVPDVEPSPPAPEEALSEERVRAWEERLDRWDAFLVFVVKTLGLASADRGVRDELLAILLDARRELVDVLRQGPVPGTDPVRNLFLSSWDRLRVQTRRALHEGRLGERAFRFVTFLAAGDALAALDQAGPGLGLEISGDGLRRLARVIDPDSPGDPIAVSEAPDPELRRLFGVEDPSLVDTAPPAAPAAAAPPTTLAPPTTTTTSPAADPTLPSSWLFAPRPAAAAEVPRPTVALHPPSTELVAIGKRLHRWVPAMAELAEYREIVARMLTTLAEHRVDRVDRRFASVYRHLVPSVAWQESCWRQFVEKGGQVVPLISSTGDIGIMQVNRRVWRGFFDVEKLKWDAVYNGGAGAEILVQLLDRYGAKEGDGLLDNAARATYAAYNGGPSAYRRYRSGKASALARAIDTDFFEKYRQVATGAAGDRVLCM